MKKWLTTFILSAITAGATLAAGVEYPAPEKGELTLAELISSRYDYIGKVVEIEANGFSRIQQESKGKYSLVCRWYDDRSFNLKASSTIYFSGDKAKKLFTKLSEKSTGGLWGEMDEEFYVYVEENMITALGKRYKKRDAEYCW